jgi:hypothetical protein
MYLLIINLLVQLFFVNSHNRRIQKKAWLTLLRISVLIFKSLIFNGKFLMGYKVIIDFLIANSKILIFNCNWQLGIQ